MVPVMNHPDESEGEFKSLIEVVFSLCWTLRLYYLNFCPISW